MFFFCYLIRRDRLKCATFNDRFHVFRSYAVLRLTNLCNLLNSVLVGRSILKRWRKMCVIRVLFASVDRIDWGDDGDETPKKYEQPTDKLHIECLWCDAVSIVILGDAQVARHECFQCVSLVIWCYENVGENFQSVTICWWVFFNDSIQCNYAQTQN